MPEPTTADPLLVSVDGDAPIHWTEFVSANADAFDADEWAAIRSALVRDGWDVIGGGAAEPVVLTVMRTPITDAQHAADVARARDHLAGLRRPAVSLPRADGFVIGQRDRALVLDLLAQQHEAGRLDGFEDHPAQTIGERAFNRAWASLATDGLVRADRAGSPDAITAAGIAAHAEAESARAELLAALPDPAPVEIVPLGVALPRRRALFGPVAA